MPQAVVDRHGDPITRSGKHSITILNAGCETTNEKLKSSEVADLIEHLNSHLLLYHQEMRLLWDWRRPEVEDVAAEPLY